MPDKSKAIGKRNTSQTPKIPKGINYLVTIGIDDYAHCEKLNNAVKDTRDIANVLFEKYNFKEKNHLKLENKEATKDNIIELFRKIKSKATKNDNVLIYYSGHGKLNEDEESFWIPVEARENKEGDFISVDKLFRLIKVIQSHHILLILDSCFSGSMLSASTSRSLNKNEIQPSRYGIASGRKQLVSDGQPGKNSPFADSIIKKLKINSESLGASDLAQAVMHLTKDATNQNQVPLHGRMRIEGDKLGEFFFHPKEENREESLWTTAVLENTIHAFDDYLEKFPNGKYADEAEQKMEDIEHEETWQKIKKNHSIVSYRKYLRRYSKGKYREEAETAIQEIKSGKKKDVVELKEEKVPVKPKVTKPSSRIINELKTFTDPRDGQTYKTVKLKDGKVWMAQNFNFELPKVEVETGFIFKTKKEEDICWQYDNADKNGKKYGRLYTWEAAIKACPEGWHLPTENEWKVRMHYYGGIDPHVLGSQSYQALIKGGESNFSALFGGIRVYNEFKYIKDFGDYWSSEFNVKEAYYVSFIKGAKRIDLETCGKSFGLSCRYVKD